MSAADKTDVWMPLYIADYLADTNRLTTIQHGAYLLLIMDYWRNGALPDDDSVLAQITRMPVDAWSIARASMEQFFSIENGVWMHKRIDEEKQKASGNRAASKAKAEKAAAARWGKDKTKQENAPSDAPSNATSNDEAKPVQCPSPSPSPTKQSTSQPCAGDRFAISATWQPSAHLPDLAKQAMVEIKPEKLAEFIAHWLTQPQTLRTQSEWDKALLQSAKHDKLHAESGTTSKPARKPDNFEQRNYGEGVTAL